METGLFRVAEVLWLKLFFFDIDGTILSHRIKDVPISTRQALCQLSDIHVDRVIATGRHSTEIDRLPVNDIKFDAYITLNGQLCYDLKGNVFYENPIKETGEILKFFHSSTDDIEMLRYVQEGIAMGNADDFVKSVADYVTADIDDNGIIQDVKFKTFGCGAAVATSSMATELVKGKTVQEALQVTNKAVMEALDGLPPVKVHCSLLAEEAIHAALWDYAEKNGIKIEGLEKPVNDISEKEEAPEEEY